MSHYTAEEKVLYAEAMRTVPGMLAAMQRKSEEDGRMLLTGYFKMGQESKVDPQQAWAIMTTACLHWIGKLAAELADITEAPQEEIPTGMSLVAVEWLLNGALHG